MKFQMNISSLHAKVESYKFNDSFQQLTSVTIGLYLGDALVTTWTVTLGEYHRDISELLDEDTELEEFVAGKLREMWNIG